MIGANRFHSLEQPNSDHLRFEHAEARTLETPRMPERLDEEARAPLFKRVLDAIHSDNQFISKFADNKKLTDDNEENYRGKDGNYFPNRKHTLGGHVYETDDNGAIYKMDGKNFPNDQYVIDGKKFFTDEAGNPLTFDTDVVTEKATANDAGNESDYPSSYKERVDRTPSENSDRGEWTGDRGESTYIPSDKTMKALLAKFGLEGIDYTDGIPDFSKCSACTVVIDNMSEKRYGKDGNFAQCDSKCAEQWNAEGKNGKTDWTARDVEKWRDTNGYSWHERNDMKTCDLVPTEVNDYFGHLGGVAECKKRDTAHNDGGDFDE